MAVPANLAGLSERTISSACHNVDRALTFWYSELDWHFHLFSQSNEKPLPFSVAARLYLEKPRGETSCNPLPNRFRVAGAVTLPQTSCHLLRYGHQMPILRWEIRLLATESVKIVSPRTSTSDNADTLAEPEAIPLDMTACRLLQDNKVTIPVSWEGLHFKLPAQKSDNDQNDLVRSFFVRLQVVATMFYGDQITISRARAGPFAFGHASKCRQQRQLESPLGESVPGSANAQPTSPAEAHTISSGKGCGRSLSDASSRDASSGKLSPRSQAINNTVPENKATRPATGPPSRPRKTYRWGPYPSFVTSTSQQ